MLPSSYVKNGSKLAKIQFKNSSCNTSTYIKKSKVRSIILHHLLWFRICIKFLKIFDDVFCGLRKKVGSTWNLNFYSPEKYLDSSVTTNSYHGGHGKIPGPVPNNVRKVELYVKESGEIEILIRNKTRLRSLKK